MIDEILEGNLKEKGETYFHDRENYGVGTDTIHSNFHKVGD